MRALLADPSARWRSIVGAILDRSGDLCTRLGCWCFAARERISPSPVDLTPAAADRILANVMARIAEPVYQPTVCDCAAADLALRTQQTLYVASTPHGTLFAAYGHQEQA